jgi:hypothetical protein
VQWIYVGQYSDRWLAVVTEWTVRFRLKKSNEIHLYADIYLLLDDSTCLGRQSRPSSGVHKTVVEASDTNRLVLVSIVYILCCTIWLR